MEPNLIAYRSLFQVLPSGGAAVAGERRGDLAADGRVVRVVELLWLGTFRGTNDRVGG